MGAHDVERAGLAGQDPAAGALPPDAAQDQRADPERVAHAHQRLVRHRHERVGADDLLERIDQPIEHGGVERDGDQVDEHLAIRRALEQATAANKLLMQVVGVGQVAVMGDREAAELEIGVERLDVAQHGVAGGGVAVVADGGGAG